MENEGRPLPSALRAAIYPRSTDPFSLKTVHWTAFRALEPPEGEGFWLLRHRSPAFPFRGRCPEGAEEVVSVHFQCGYFN